MVMTNDLIMIYHKLFYSDQTLLWVKNRSDKNKQTNTEVCKEVWQSRQNHREKLCESWARHSQSSGRF